MDVLVAKRSDGAEMHITGYFDDGWAKGYLVINDEEMLIPFPLASLFRSDDEWTSMLSEEDMKRAPLFKEPESQISEKTLFSSDDTKYYRVVIKDD